MTTPSSGASRRFLSEVAAATGEMRAAEARRSKAAERRGVASLRAQQEGASYEELREATGLTKVGVYKMLRTAAGGSLRDRNADG